MLIFLTGGTGFIGHHIAKALLDSGHQLRILARNPQKIPSLAKHPQVQMIPGELLDFAAIANALVGCDACIHVALGWGDTPLAMLDHDTRATIHLLQAAHEAGCHKFIYTSSTAAMGEMRNPMHTELRNLPTDLYGATKAASEAFVLGYRPRGMQRNIIRPGYTFGNPAWPDGVTQPDARFRHIAQAVHNGSPIHLIQHDGTQFIHAAQIAQLYCKLVESDCNGETLLALGSEWVSWEEIARMALAQKPDSNAPIVLEDRGWGAEPIRFDVSTMKNLFELSFDPRPDLQEHVRWCLAQAAL